MFLQSRQTYTDIDLIDYKVETSETAAQWHFHQVQPLGGDAGSVSGCDVISRINV